MRGSHFPAKVDVKVGCEPYLRATCFHDFERFGRFKMYKKGLVDTISTLGGGFNPFEK